MVANGRNKAVQLSSSALYFQERWLYKYEQIEEREREKDTF